MKRRAIPLLCLLACAAGAFLLGSPAVSQEEFVKIDPVNKDRFTYRGSTVRLKGTNYYPKKHMWGTMWNDWDWDEMLTEVTFIRESGMNCARILVPYHNDHGGWGNGSPPAGRLQMLEDLVNMFGQNGIRTCITLFDWETSFYYPEESGYNTHINYLTTIVNRFKDNKYVFMWDVKNEPDHPENLNYALFHSNPQVVVDSWDDPRTVPGKKDRIVTWLRNMCTELKKIDTNHPVSCGIRYFGNVKDVLDFEHIAIYHSYWWTMPDTEYNTVRAAMGTDIKPVLIEEYGWPSYPTSRGFAENYETFPVHGLTGQLTVYAAELAAQERNNMAGSMQWMTFDDRNYGDQTSHEYYFGLWHYDYSPKPVLDYFKTHYISAPFPYTDTTPPGSAWGLKAEAKNGANYVSWFNPAALDYSATLVRFSTTGYPQSITDGQLLTDQLGTPGGSGSFLHQGLTNGVTYYYTAFARDRFGNYSTDFKDGMWASGTPYVPPVVSILPNGTIDTVTGGVANSWTSYRVNDPNNVFQFKSGDWFESAPVAQAVGGLQSTSLPASSVSAAGIRQVVPATLGKTYMLVGMQDLTGSANGARYLHNFGINTTGGTSPGTANTGGTIGGAKWMGSGLTFWNNSSGGAPGIGGFHRVVAAFTAEANQISVWSGVTVSTAAAPTVAADFVADSNCLYELDNPVNYSNQLINPGFEQIFNLQNGQDILPVGWLPVGGGIAQKDYVYWKVVSGTGVPRNGAYAARVHSRRGHHNMGYMQKISTRAGTPISFSCYVINNDAINSTAYVGIDPTGGTDINAGTVAWSSTRNTAWTLLTATATAQASTATLFVRGSSIGGDPGVYHYTTFDDASATWTPSDNVAPANPSYAQDLGGATNNQWTNRTSPNFAFGGASDTGGAGIANYDVYWGTSSTGSGVSATVINPAYQPSTLSAAGTYYLRVRTRDAAGNVAGWATIFTYKFDPTAPTTPDTVATSAYIVDGKITATWGPAVDGESGISAYKYAVGTAPGGADVVDWTGVGNVTRVDISGMSVQPQSTCYITVKATNGANADGPGAASQQVTAAASEAAVSGAKLHANGEAVCLKGKVVTAAFADRFYIEEPSRFAGIAVISTSAPAPGSIVDVVGRMDTTADWERCLTAPEVTVTPERASVIPVAMNGRMLGGAGYHFDISALVGQRGLQAWTWNSDNRLDLSSHVLIDLTGLNNVGLLVKTWGKVGTIGSGVFHLDDGSGYDDGDPASPGFCVAMPSGISLNPGDIVSVTGISSCMLKDQNVYRLLRPVDNGVQVIRSAK